MPKWVFEAYIAGFASGIFEEETEEEAMESIKDDLEAIHPMIKVQSISLEEADEGDLE